MKNILIAGATGLFVGIVLEQCLLSKYINKDKVVFSSNVLFST